MQLSSALLSAVLAGLAPTLAENTFFPWADDTNRPECKTCLDELVSDTCGGDSDPDFRTCMCDGAGATRLNDECFPTCCSASTVCTGQGPYKEWWLLCVDEYPQLCADPPPAVGINTDLEEHCTRDEIDTANDAKNDTDELDDDQFDLDLDSSASGLGVYSTVLGSVFGLAILAVAMRIC